MPQIINAYAANDSIANSLRSLGESMFGNQSRDELVRENALAKRRENVAIPALAEALARGDYGEATRQGVLGDKTPSFTAGYGQYYGVNRFGPGSEQGTRATMAVPGANYGNTVTGTREHEANQRTITGMQGETQRAVSQMQTERAMELKKWEDEHTLVDMQAPDRSRIIKVKKSEVPAMQSQGYQVAPSLDQVKATLVAPAVTPAAPPAAPAAPAQPPQTTATPASATPTPATPPAPTAAPSGGLSGLTQDQRSIVGLPTGTQHFLNPATGDVAVSHDGGQTYVMPNGQGGAVMGSGLQPVSPEAALAQVRANAMRDEVRVTPKPSLEFGNSQLAQDAYKASGVDAAITREANNSVGSVAGPLIGEIGAPTQRATERVTAAVNAARTALLTNEFRQSKYSQEQIDKILPQGSGYANPVTAANSLGAVLRELGMEEQHLRQVIDSPNTPIDLKHKAFAAWQQTHRAIAMFTAPAEAPVGPAKPAVAPGTPAPQGDPLSQARAAIAAGADRAAVIQRLQQNGINPTGL
jgi:hypothetical protein